MRPSRVVAKSLFATLDWALPPPHGPRILIYHQVAAGHGEELDVELDTFRRHLDWMARSDAEVISLANAIEAREQDHAHRLVVLTFDDGYEDMYLRAFPLLRERSLPFTLYLTTRPTETGHPLTTRRPSQPLTWDQVGEMNESGLMTLGVHTHTHPDLRFLEADAVAEELEASDQLIALRTGVTPTHFAYPWGFWSASADSLVRTRYSSAVLGGSFRVSDGADPHLIHRIPIQLSDGMIFYRHKLKRGQRTEERVRRLITRYNGP